MASGGTVFLTDRELPKELQAKLLNVLQAGLRAGGDSPPR